MHLIIKKTSFGSSIEPSYSVVGTAKTYELATKLIEAHNLINESKSVEFHAVEFEAEPLVLTVIVFTVMLMSSCSTSNYACGITPLNKQYRMTCR